MSSSVYLVESGGRGRQDGPTEFLHGADGSRESRSGEQRCHQVYPEDPRHHLLLASGKREREREQSAGLMKGERADKCTG